MFYNFRRVRPRIGNIVGGRLNRREVDSDATTQTGLV
jgi:hypothetical protein